jgi:hypothetical protein
MSAEFPGLEARAHELAANGFITLAEGVDALVAEFEGLGREQAREACLGHGPMCSHPGKTEEQLRARFYRQRVSDRERARQVLRTRLGIDEDAESMLAVLEEAGMVVVTDVCVPDHGHHTNPHKGCVLR